MILYIIHIFIHHNLHIYVNIFSLNVQSFTVRIYNYKLFIDKVTYKEKTSHNGVLFIFLDMPL